MLDQRVRQINVVDSVLPTRYNQLDRVDSASAHSGRRSLTQLTSSSVLCPMTIVLSQSSLQMFVLGVLINLSPAFCKMLSLK